jgi:hypothetical protein
VLWSGTALSARAQDATQGRVMGLVTDGSGGALPGVTVTVTSGSTPSASIVTDAVGRYLTPWLPPGTYTLTFVLSGFETRTVTGLRLDAGQTIVLDQQLPLGALSEIVEVRAPAPPPPPPPPRPPVRIIPPRPQATPVDREILVSVCGPRLPPSFSLTVGRVLSHRDDGRQLLGPGDLLRIDAGAEQGLSLGQNLVVRRRFFNTETWTLKKAEVDGEQTAGLVQIVEIDRKSSVAQVVYACGEIVAGDSVERYVPQPAFFAVPEGTPRFDEPARVTFGADGQQAGAAGHMMVIDRGLMQGVLRGQRITIFRRVDAAPPRAIGEGIVVAARADSATIRIERSTDAVIVGDLVALHR